MIAVVECSEIVACMPKGGHLLILLVEYRRFTVACKASGFGISHGANEITGK